MLCRGRCDNIRVCLLQRLQGAVQQLLYPAPVGRSNMINLTQAELVKICSCSIRVKPVNLIGNHPDVFVLPAQVISDADICGCHAVAGVDEEKNDVSFINGL